MFRSRWKRLLISQRIFRLGFKEWQTITIANKLKKKKNSKRLLYHISLSYNYFCVTKHAQSVHLLMWARDTSVLQLKIKWVIRLFPPLSVTVCVPDGFLKGFALDHVKTSDWWRGRSTTLTTRRKCEGWGLWEPLATCSFHCFAPLTERKQKNVKIFSKRNTNLEKSILKMKIFSIGLVQVL